METFVNSFSPHFCCGMLPSSTFATTVILCTLVEKKTQNHKTISSEFQQWLNEKEYLHTILNITTLLSTKNIKIG